MKPLFQFALISTGLVFLTACTSHIEKPLPSPAAQSQNKNTKKKSNPFKVSFYKSTPKKPYTIVGEESISKFNQGGIKRQEANIRYAMSELAAAMGGDAVINIKSDGKSITGTVVAFEQEADLALNTKLAQQKS